MSAQSKPIDVAPGTILPGPRQFIRRLFVESPNDPVDVEIPGQILRCGDDLDFSVLPYAQIIDRAGPIARSALLSAEVRDELGLKRAMAELRHRHGAEPIEGFAIRFSSHRSLAAVLDLAEEANDGCGCSGGASYKSLPGAISVGVRAAGDHAWTPPFAARLAVFADIYSGDGSFIFSCHSVWFGWFDHSTACEGDLCGGKRDCRCDNYGEGKTLFNCPGWRICVCK